MDRQSYPLPITELQVRAEQTRYRNHDGARTTSNPAQACADAYYQVEVRHLVRHVAHLPPEVACHFKRTLGLRRLMGKYGEQGFGLLPNRHTVLEVRPLRALLPMLSTRPQFCALNLYQLALMATLSYCPFGQSPRDLPVRGGLVSFPRQPSVGNMLGDALCRFDEVWQVDAGQKQAYYPLYEDVAYSRRLEVVPFDSGLYPQNNPELRDKQENPESLHFLDDSRQSTGGTDSQAFITHNDELILIAIRGTSEMPWDALRDVDALQVPFEEGEGKVHRGFYQAAQVVLGFVLNYLEKFYAGQRLMICGHSLGGAIALLVSEMLRRKPDGYSISLYTYGAPRAGDATFVKGAEALKHYRMVNHNDPVPSVPGTWLNTKPSVYGSGVAMTFANVPVGLSVFVAGISNWGGEPYAHHGLLWHFFPVQFDTHEQSSILWSPGCDTVSQHAACSLALRQRNGLPERQSLLAQMFSAGNHSMVGGYIPSCWATLRRWQETYELKRYLVTRREFNQVDEALVSIEAQLRQQHHNLFARPDAYVNAHEHEVRALAREAEQVKNTRERLLMLHTIRLHAEDVYGHYASQAAILTASLERWRQHPENLKAEQLAMAPVSADDDRVLAFNWEDVFNDDDGDEPS
ncbi:lipase family protein [Pseudomonas laurentiana]|uniref:lipase family protein n=1 Tax=Pseudomonas laurentiana TaxID=2364649 RepID=UPI001E38E7B8|nr:lipase family protein [Pseudomonas laurentiana]